MTDEVRVSFAGGGTGGHLFPAIAVADALKEMRPEADIDFIGSRRGLETRLVPRAGYPLRTLPLGGLKGAGSVRRLASAVQAAAGVARTAWWMLRRRPALVVGVGGFASGPAMLAAIGLRVPTMILEQNHYPGATNRWLAGRVGRVCVPSAAARERLGGIGEITGNPVRHAFTEIGPAPDGDTPSLLVFGGSRGARSINRATVDALDALARMDDPPRIVHQTGPDDHDTVLRAYRDRYPEDRHEVHAFLDDMPARLEAADFVICRAGATTLAELAVAGRASLLVPYPHAADDHQRHNAEAVASAGAAVVVLDRELDGARVAEIVREVACDRERRRGMGEAARALGIPDAARRIATIAASMIATPAERGGARVP